jgi:hypothetical protein
VSAAKALASRRRSAVLNPATTPATRRQLRAPHAAASPPTMPPTAHAVFRVALRACLLARVRCCAWLGHLLLPGYLVGFVSGPNVAESSEFRRTILGAVSVCVCVHVVGKQGGLRVLGACPRCVFPGCQCLLCFPCVSTPVARLAPRHTFTMPRGTSLQPTQSGRAGVSPQGCLRRPPLLL